MTIGAVIAVIVIAVIAVIVVIILYVSKRKNKVFGEPRTEENEYISKDEM